MQAVRFFAIWSLLAVAMIAAATNSAKAQSVPILNDNDVALNCWVTRQGVRGWEQHITLPRHSVGQIDASNPGPYYVQLQSFERQSFPPEWLNLNAAITADPNYFLKCSQLYESSGIKKKFIIGGRVVWRWVPINKPAGFSITEQSLRPAAPPAPPAPTIYFYPPPPLGYGR